MIIKITELNDTRAKLLFVGNDGKAFAEIWAPRDEMPEGIEDNREVALTLAYTYIPRRLRVGLLKKLFAWQA